MKSWEDPMGARSQGEPGSPLAARYSQEGPVTARKSKGQPGKARKSQEEPGGGQTNPQKIARNHETSFLFSREIPKASKILSRPDSGHQINKKLPCRG